MTGSVSVEVIDSVAGLRALEDQWNELLHGSDTPHPMCSYAWIASCLEHLLEEDVGWFCLFVFDGTHLIGVLPVLQRRRGPPFPVIERATPTNTHTISVGVTAEPGREVEVVRALSETLLHRDRGPFSRMKFRRHYLGAVVEALARGHEKLRVTVASGGVGSMLHVPDDFGAFRASLSRNFRGNLNKARRRLDALPEVRFSFQSGADATEAQLDRFASVEVDGWKGREGTAIKQSSSLTAFYRSATRRLSRAGWLEWHFVETAGQTIAGHLAIRCGRNLLLWKIGFRERFAFCAPGNLLFEEMVRHRCRSRDVDTIDVLTSYAWHRFWGMSEQEYFDVTLYRRDSGPASLHYFVHQCRAELRRVPGAQLLMSKLRRI